ncbi:hypothetical protein HY485_00555 [Candidatus Woesearchaeota archaeon]|nr:hypothetical protein [Candidatus Woesearchaeota archaeon]
MARKISKDTLYEKLERIEIELSFARRQIKIETNNVGRLRLQRAEIYEQQAAADADISQKFGDYKTPKPSTQNHYDDAKSAIKAVYYTIRESGKDGLGLAELQDILATRTNNEIRDAVWFLHDGGDIYGPTLNWKWKVEQ